MELEPGRRLLEAIAELHQRGYARLRIAPGLSPSGTHWRCGITAVRWDEARGPDARGSVRLLARYGSGQGTSYFGWTDANVPATHLATLMEERCAWLAQCRGDDAAYTAWFVDMLHVTWPDAVPVSFADFDLPPGGWSTVGGGLSLVIPYPPG